MISLRKTRFRFSQISNSILYFYNPSEQISRKKLVIASGVLNTIWNRWNNFWRLYWLAYLNGGYNFNQTKISPLEPTKTISQSLYYMLYLVKKRNTPNGSITNSYQEATWGNIQKIQDIASALVQQNNNINQVLLAINSFGRTIEHIQIVRNTLIHIDKDNMENVRRKVVPYYLIAKLKTPYALIESKEIQTQKMALKFWVDEMNGFLNFLN